MVQWKNVEHPVGIRIYLSSWLMKWKNAVGSWNHALENVVMNGKSLEATRATSWAKMSMGFRKQKRSQRSTIWHGSNLPHVCRLEKRNKKREFPVVKNHLASRWHHQLPPLLALPWPQQPNSPPNMGSFFVAPSTFGISPGGIAKAIPPPPGPFLSVMQLSTHQREGDTEKGRQNQPPVTGGGPRCIIWKKYRPLKTNSYGSPPGVQFSKLIYVISNCVISFSMSCLFTWQTGKSLFSIGNATSFMVEFPASHVTFRGGGVKMKVKIPWDECRSNGWQEHTRTLYKIL